MNYEGKIVNILAVETISTGGGDRQKQTIVLEENRESEYKGGIVVDFWGDKLALLQEVSVGDIVTVGLNSKAREYNGRWYNSITGWKIDRQGSTESNVTIPPAASAAGIGGESTPSTSNEAKPAPIEDNVDDELPF